MTLRSYQTEAVDAVISEWGLYRSVLLVMATGTGKTRTGAEIIRRRVEHGRVLWLAHREELIAQAADAIERNAGLRCEIEKADRYATDGRALVSGEVVVASVQSLQGRRRERFGADHFGTVIVDEAHHAPARSYRKILEHFTTAKILGLTATPDRGDKIGLKATFETVAYQYEIRRGISDGYLCPIRQLTIECAGIDLSDIKTVAGDLKQGDLEKAMMVDEALHQVSGPLAKEAGKRSTIVFTAGVAQAHALADVLQAYVGDAGVRVVDGSTPPELRRQYLAAFGDGSVQFMINCAVLTEGFDAPRTACVAVARPTKSRALYAQMIGRGTRVAEGKDDCLILDFVGNAGRHKLVTPLDVLEGKPLPEEVEQIARELTEKGMPSMEALEEAKAEAIRRAEEREARRLREARIKAETAYRKQAVDPFDLFGIDENPGGPRATERQLEYLRGKGIEVGNPSRRQASGLIDALMHRRKEGLCTYKQARQLAKRGLRTDLSFTEAGEVITAIASNNWKTPNHIADKYRAPALQEAM